MASYDLIVFEKLNIPDMVQANFARSILDAAWGMLGKQLTYKAEEAGKWAIPVAPRVHHADLLGMRPGAEEAALPAGASVSLRAGNESRSERRHQHFTAR